MKSHSVDHRFVRIGKSQCIMKQIHIALTELNQRSVSLPIKWFVPILNKPLNFPIPTQTYKMRKYKINYMYHLYFKIYNDNLFNVCTVQHLQYKFTHKKGKLQFTNVQYQGFRYRQPIP